MKVCFCLRRALKTNLFTCTFIELYEEENQLTRKSLWIRSKGILCIQILMFFHRSDHTTPGCTELTETDILLSRSWRYNWLDDATIRSFESAYALWLEYSDQWSTLQHKIIPMLVKCLILFENIYTCGKRKKYNNK